MKDFFKQDLAIGDTVAFITSQYRDFTLGIIADITDKQVRIAYPGYSGSMNTTLRYPSAVIKKV